MGHVHVSKTKFRYPVPDDCIQRRFNCNSQHGQEICMSDDYQAGLNGGESLDSPIWITSTIPDGWMWKFSSECETLSDQCTEQINRQSICKLEGDASVDEILNQQCNSYTSLSQTSSDLKMVQSLVPICKVFLPLGIMLFICNTWNLTLLVCSFVAEIDAPPSEKKDASLELFSISDVQSSEIIGTWNSETAYAEALQAILSPLLPSTTIDKINRTSELARAFGIDFFSVLSRGSQYRVESMLLLHWHIHRTVLPFLLGINRREDIASKEWAFVNVCHFLEAYQYPIKSFLSIFNICASLSLELTLVLHFEPRYGQTNILVYLGICSLAGSVTHF
ncbi:DNA polymerase zeta catalytic subunit [Euphorbia peplus]|nr:DNA polymerase zeta catalytic subunit [Euphorbia peplus]